MVPGIQVLHSNMHTLYSTHCAISLTANSHFCVSRKYLPTRSHIIITFCRVIFTWASSCKVWLYSLIKKEKTTEARWVSNYARFPELVTVVVRAGHTYCLTRSVCYIMPSKWDLYGYILPCVYFIKNKMVYQYNSVDFQTLR